MILAAVTTGLLAATFGLILWTDSRSRLRRAVRPSLAGSLVVLLAALAVMSAVSPSSEPTAFPVGQSILLAVSVVLFSVAWSQRKQPSVEVTMAIDTATVDALTRVASHGAFQDRLAHECERAYRFGDTFILAMLDLDNFHPVNNRFGHRVGDRILIDLARRLTSQLREIDLVARFGGDQFALILPHTYEKGGLEVAERIRQSVAGWVFVTPEGADIRLTVSLGMCSYPSDGASPPALVEAAQKALGFAKAMGGNQLQLSRDLPPREAADNVLSLPHSGREAIVRSLAAAVDIRDGYTHMHSHLVSELSAAVARRLGLSPAEVARISVGALLHDVGKIGVPDAILTKEGSLTPEEWACIRQHPGLGKQILEQAPELRDVMPLVLHHQERWDGTGYPGNLKGDAIALGARIIAVADAYHAIISDRPYRSGRTHQEASRELRRCSGGQFDPRVVDTLLAVIETDKVLRTKLPVEVGPHAVERPALRPAPVPVVAALTNQGA